MIPSGSRRSFRIAVRKYPPFESAIESQWNAFEAQSRTGLELEIVALDLEPLQETLFTSNGMTSGEWDIAFVNTDWIAAIDKGRGGSGFGSATVERSASAVARGLGAVSPTASKCRRQDLGHSIPRRPGMPDLSGRPVRGCCQSSRV